MNRKIIALAFLISPMPLVAADACSPQEQHQSKYEKFMINDVPSLLEACGLGLSISLPTFSIPSLGDLFCGYSANDINDWYKDNYKNSSRNNISSSTALANANRSAVAQQASRNQSQPAQSSTPFFSQKSLNINAAVQNSDTLRELQQLTDSDAYSDPETVVEKNTVVEKSNEPPKWEPANLFKSK